MTQTRFLPGFVCFFLIGFVSLSLGAKKEALPELSNESKTAEGFLVDNFEDGDNSAVGWGLWVCAQGGPNNDNSGTLIFSGQGVAGKAASYSYTIDSGGWSYNHIALDFGKSVDLLSTGVMEISFWMKGSGPGSVKFFPSSSLSGQDNGYGNYKIDLGPAPREWKKYTLKFKSCAWEGQAQTFTWEQALKTVTGLKWETGGVPGAAGKILVDHVRIVNDGTTPSFMQVAAPPRPEYEKPPAINWQMVWSDEFDKDGLPDPAKWSFEDRRPGWVNNESQNYPGPRLENARVSNGFLIIEARKDGFNGHAYSSARIHTAGKGDILYGRVEVRAKLPEGRGTWPAIWMMPTDYFGYGNGWPDSGEIDIMEQVGKDPNWVHASIHCQNYYHVKGNQKTARIFDSTLSSDFHVYAIEWKKGQIDIYMDDMKFFTVKDPGEGWQGWPFDKKFYLILNLAIGGAWGGAVDDSIFPQRMTVDYVRMYRAPVRR